MSAGLRSPVREILLSGWSLVATGVGGGAIGLALSDTPGWDALGLAFFAALFAGGGWLFDGRRTVRNALAAPPFPEPGAVVEPFAPRRRRILALQALYAAVILAFSIAADPSVAGIPLGIGIYELAVARRLRGWERRSGRRLLRENELWLARAA